MNYEAELERVFTKVDEAEMAIKTVHAIMVLHEAGTRSYLQPGTVESVPSLLKIALDSLDKAQENRIPF